MFEEIVESGPKMIPINLPVLDGNYFDTLVALGYAKLAQSYLEDGGETRIEFTGMSYRVYRGTQKRSAPKLEWLNYSLPASWDTEKNREKLHVERVIFKDTSYNGVREVPHYGQIVNTKDTKTILVEEGGKERSITEPLRELFGVINKHGSPAWLNNCIHICRTRTEDLLDGSFSEAKISFNSIVYPQSNKGANSSSSFSIGNGSLSAGTVKVWSREICLAVAGLIFASRGSIQAGFAIPFPRNITVEDLDSLISKNRRRTIWRGFFFNIDNYLHYLRTVLVYKGRYNPRKLLRAVGGVRFITLGAAASPAGVWQFTVPDYDYSLRNVERLKNLLRAWRRSVKPKSTSEPNIDRAGVTRLVRGFEKGTLSEFLEGFFAFLSSIDIRDQYRFSILHENQLTEIMNSQSKYSQLLEAVTGADIQPFIQLVRQDTYSRAIVKKGGKPTHPDYQLIRKLQEVQTATDLMIALNEISIKRSIDKFASANSSKDALKMHKMPTQTAIKAIMELTEEHGYSPRLVAQTVLAMAMSRRDYDSDAGKGSNGEEE